MSNPQQPMRSKMPQPDELRAMLREVYRDLSQSGQAFYRGFLSRQIIGANTAADRATFRRYNTAMTRLKELIQPDTAGVQP